MCVLALLCAIVFVCVCERVCARMCVCVCVLHTTPHPATHSSPPPKQTLAESRPPSTSLKNNENQRQALTATFHFHSTSGPFRQEAAAAVTSGYQQRCSRGLLCSVAAKTGCLLRWQFGPTVAVAALFPSPAARHSPGKQARGLSNSRRAACKCAVRRPEEKSWSFSLSVAYFATSIQEYGIGEY